MAAGGEDLWRECASWLTRCGLLRPDHKANWETSTIHDLAYTLRDGVLLCNLLNVLNPGCIDMKEVNQRPQMAQVTDPGRATFALITIKALISASVGVTSVQLVARTFELHDFGQG